MIIQYVPKGSTKESVTLSTFFSNKDNIYYLISSNLQRRYCWPSAYIDKLYQDYVINLYDKNVDADKTGDDTYYGTAGDAILTRIEEGEQKCKKQEIIDASQRITTTKAIVAVMLYVNMEKNNIKEDERRKIYDTYFKTKNGMSEKIVSTFKDDDFKVVIEDLVKSNFKTDDKSIKCLTKCFNCNVKKNEIVYKSFREICAYVYSLIDSTIGTDADDIIERLHSFLEKTYIQVEVCEKKDRIKKFREVNSYRVGIEDKDIYKGILCEKGDKVDSKFQDFEDKIKLITNKGNKRINILKTQITPTEYIMKIALIVMDKTRESCKSNFSLNDEKNGIEYHCNEGLLDTEDKVLKYLDTCISICVFLLNSMDYKQEGFNEEWYLLTENHTQSHIWLYNILPSYIISTINDDDKKTFAFEILFKSYITYSLKYSVNRSVQYIQNYMYSLSKEILNYSDNKYCFDDFKSSLETIYNKTFGDFISNNLTKAIKHLDYSQASSKSGIYAILSYIEFLSQKSCGKKRDNLHKLTKKNEIEIDHIFPQSQKNDSNELEIDSIGNLTFLEKVLNGSKQDNETSTFDRYCDTSFISTKLMIDGNRYEGLTNQQIKYLQNKIVPFLTDKETINNFENRIKERTTAIANMMRRELSPS